MKKGLGKGLQALISVKESDEPNSAGVTEVDINSVEPAKGQPRRRFDGEKLNELAESIKNVGIIQPLIVKDESGWYSLIAGERRWRAARLAGLARVPVIIRDYSEIGALEAALIENIQRADLNPVEEADCYRRLIDEHKLTQEDLSVRVGKNRSHISNSLRVLKLPESVREHIINERISMGHARALLPLNDAEGQTRLAERIVTENLSVRETEDAVKNLLENREIKNPKRRIFTKSPEIGAIEKDLSLSLGAKVVVRDAQGKGKIEISYNSRDELNALFAAIRN
jgi:ParB family chromosome partitioning protein